MSISTAQYLLMKARLNANTKPKNGTVKNSAAGLCANDSKPDEGCSLVREPQREEARWHGPASRFGITFTVFSQRPADYDAYDIKALQDFLVHSAIIPDDKWNVLSGRIVSRKAHKKEDERTEIEITPLYEP